LKEKSCGEPKEEGQENKRLYYPVKKPWSNSATPESTGSREWELIGGDGGRLGHELATAKQEHGKYGTQSTRAKGHLTLCTNGLNSWR